MTPALNSSAPALITYADRLAGDIDGADAGFDPVDHTDVDPRIGSWDNITALAGRFRVMADLIVNHVSSTSEPFLDWLSSAGPRRQSACLRACL